MKTSKRTLAQPLLVAAIALGSTLAATAQPGPMMGAGPMASGPMAGRGGPGYGPGPGSGYGPGPSYGMGMHDGAGWGGPGAMMGGMLYRMLDRVNATPEQRTQIQQIMDRARSEMQAQHQAGRGLRDEALALFAQPTVDAAAAEALRQKMQAQHDAASKRMLQSMLDVAKVLSPEQRRQMADFMKQRREMMERHQRERQGLEGARR